jgi:DNA repair exonuclease SbcCD nuclease subunit
MVNVPVLLLSDPHFHAFKTHSRLIDGVNSRLLDVLSTCNQAIELAKENGVELVLMPGDLFQVRGQIKPSVFNMVMDWLQTVVLAEMDVVLIPGNHDMESLKGGATSIDALAYIRGRTGNGRPERTIHILTERKPIVYLHGMKILGLPYMHDSVLFRRTFIDLSREHDPRITLIHQGIDDFDAENAPETGIRAQFLLNENGGLIVSGHYHKPGRRGRLVNVGAPLQHRLSDQGQDRGCWIVKPGHNPEFHPLESPRFVFLDMNSPVEDWGALAGNFIHIRTADAKTGEAARQEALRRGAASVHVQIERVFKPTKSRNIAISSPRQMLMDFCGMVDKYQAKKESILRAFDKLNIPGADL